MELKEYLNIFQKNIRWFWLTVIIFLVGAGMWQYNQSETFEATLLLNIGRTHFQETKDYYTYDSFYRLQADERFADTVVRWLGSPRVVEDIYKTVRIETATIDSQDLSKVFRAKRLSSQMIEVTYRYPDEQMLQNISSAMVENLNKYTDQLNEQKDEKTSWFIVIGSDPVIRYVFVSLRLVLFLGLILGIFCGFWVALLRHYFSR